jgi:hypothetical protein
VSFALIVLISFVVQRQFINKTNQIQKERLFTADELQTYTKDELYLAVLGKINSNLIKKINILIHIGHVFNVSSAPKFYSSTGSYKFYTGIHKTFIKTFFYRYSN